MLAKWHIQNGEAQSLACIILVGILDRSLPVGPVSLPHFY